MLHRIIWNSSLICRVDSGNHSFSWIEPPSNVLIVKKERDERATNAMRRIIT